MGGSGHPYGREPHAQANAPKQLPGPEAGDDSAQDRKPGD